MFSIELLLLFMGEISLYVCATCEWCHLIFQLFLVWVLYLRFCVMVVVVVVLGFLRRLKWNCERADVVMEKEIRRG